MDLMPFQHLIEGLTDVEGAVWDIEKGVHSSIYEFGIETPVELEIWVDDAGIVQIRSAPPLYYVDTTFRPSYHAIRFTALKFEYPYGSPE